MFLRLVAYLFCALLLARAASADEPRKIEVTGAQTVTADEIRGYLEFAAGKDADARMIDKSIKTLMATGIFSDVRIELKSGSLRVAVVENPIIASVAFRGESAVEKKDLEGAAKLKVRERYSKARAHADAVAIEALYRTKGRMQTTVEPSAVTRSDRRIDLTYVIKEAAVSKIERIVFEGNRGVPERDLRYVISTSESGWFDILKTAAFYDPERIRNDRELVRRFYINHGYPDARVSDVKAELNAEKSAYTITFVIDEGDRRAFGAAKVESRITLANQNALLGSSKVVSGKPYSQDDVDLSADAMTEKLIALGQPFARVRAVPETDRESGRVDILFRIEQGKPLYVGRIDIVGNVRTKDHVIRRELRFSEGDPLNAFQIEAAKKRLRGLGIFKTVEITPKQNGVEDRADLTVAVTEDETGNLGFGGGYSTSEGVVGDISWTERNLMGNGQYLRIKLSGSLVRLQTDIGFTEPHFLGSNVAAGFDLFYKDVDFTQQASYKSTKVGGDVRAAFPITDQVATSINYTFVHNTIYDVGPNASAAIKEAVPGYPNATSASYNTSSIGYSTSYNTVDNKKRPTSGVAFTVSQDLAGVGGDVQYVRTTADVRVYQPVTDAVTLMGRAQGGIIQGWGGQDVRLLDLFYKGGDIVRGFAPAGLGPRDTLSANMDALGGRMYAATTAEALFDLPGVPKDIGLRGTVFADAGSLWGTTSTAAALPGVKGGTPTLVASTGVGLVWDSPIGALSASYAVPLVKTPYDKLQPFSLGVGGF
ncbi:MAG: outer membrane protein assembly factor BamA [Proteobacteria bacterium]|nr:outer membrane protein assembly factor BamA [Pseudomonadota bacterium]